MPHHISGRDLRGDTRHGLQYVRQDARVSGPVVYRGRLDVYVSSLACIMLHSRAVRVVQFIFHESTVTGRYLAES